MEIIISNNMKIKLLINESMLIYRAGSRGGSRGFIPGRNILEGVIFVIINN
jgi:hypothetical protein